MKPLTQQQSNALRRLAMLGVGSAAQIETTDDLLESLQAMGLAMPRRWHDPAIRLWQPTRQGDALAVTLDSGRFQDKVS